MKNLYQYAHWKSKFAILSVFIILNNLMGCEQTCLLQPQGISISNEQIAVTNASFDISIIAGDNPTLSKSEVGCSENCEFVSCTIGSFNYEVLDASGNQIIVDPGIYDQIFKNHVVRESTSRPSINRTITLSNLIPASTYTLTVSFPISHTCLASGPSETSITFSTLPQECEVLTCGENGTFDQELCSCNCDEGYSGVNCEIQNTVAPTGLIYEPDSLVVNVNQEAVSPQPTVEGTPPLNFELVSISPDDGSVTTSIDANTGVIRLASTVANDYQAEIRVTNSAGEATFQRAFVATVLDQSGSGPPTDLIYDPDTVNYNGIGVFQSVQPQVIGSLPASFSKAAVSPQNAAGAIVVDPNTGVINASDLLEFGQGTYQVDVTVTNDDGTATFPMVYTLIVEN